MLDRRSQAIYDKPFLGRKEVNGRKRARDPEGIAFKVGDSREQEGGRVVRRMPRVPELGTRPRKPYPLVQSRERRVEKHHGDETVPEELAE